MKNADIILDKLRKKVEARNIADVCPGNVVQLIETVSANVENVTGRDKRKAAVTWLIDSVKIPFVPKWLKSFIFGRLIDQLVACFNGKFGDEWSG